MNYQGLEISTVHRGAVSARRHRTPLSFLTLPKAMSFPLLSSLIAWLIMVSYDYNRVISAVSKSGSALDHIHLISVPDGLGPGENRNDLGGLSEGLHKTMPGCLEDLIQKTNEFGGNKFTCMIVDQSLAYLLEVAKKTGLRSTAFFPSAAALLATMLSIPKLIEDGVVDADGIPIKNEMFQLSPSMHPMNPAHFVWNLIGDAEAHKQLFRYFALNNRATEIADIVICNTCFEIEQPVFTYILKLIPVGPLLTGHRLGKTIGNFWPEDLTCIPWLDKQPANSVVYVAFGSYTIFAQRQFEVGFVSKEQWTKGGRGRRWVRVQRTNQFEVGGIAWGREHQSASTIVKAYG